MKTFSILRAIALTLVVCALEPILASCGGTHKQPPAADLHTWQATGDATLSETLAELDRLKAPKNVDEVLFAQLKEELARLLAARSQVPSAIRLASEPPSGDANKVADLEATDNGDDTYTLSWHYVNSGDYDQNGTVGISDITPIAMHYNEEVPVDDTERNSLQAVIDGSENGKVDIADITPIAMYYGSECAGYRIQRGESADGQFTSFDNILLEDATGDGRLFFQTEPFLVIQPYLRVTPYDSEGEPGEPSDPVFIELPGDPPEIVSVSPDSGMESESVEFSAVVNGTPPFTYSWNFGGGANPNTSSAAQPEVTLQTAGEYSASLTVINDFGEDTYPFTLTVTEEVTYSVSGHVEKDTGGGLEGATLTLTPGNYSSATNASGDYTITDVPDGDYTLTPALANWTFAPVTRSVNVSGGNVTDKDFTATYSSGGDCVVSGHVEKSTGGPLQGVTLTLTPGGYTDDTDASGNFTIVDIPAGTYDLTPTLAGWSFDPTAHEDIEVTPSSMTPYFFTASPL